MPVSTSGISVPSLGQGIDTSIYNNQNAPKSMSIADMLNISKGQLELQKARETLQPGIEQAKAQSQLSQTQARVGLQGESEKYANTFMDILGGFRQDPRLKSKNPQERAAVILEAKQRARNAGVPELQLEALSAPIMTKAAHSQDPNDLVQTVDSVIQSRMTASEKQALNTPQLTTVNDQPALFTPGSGTISPVKGIQGGNQGQDSGNQNNQGNKGVQPNQMEKPEYSQPVALPYPVRQAGTPFAQLPQEKADVENNVKYKENLLSYQNNVTTNKENLRHVIEGAENLKQELGGFWTKGVAGAARRNIESFLGTDAGIQYKQLSKDLANVQIANIKAQGGSLDTVNGQQLQAAANGDYTFPPDILVNIARRAQADINNLDMQATAASKFSKKYGDNNLGAFKQMWSKNADSRIFQVIALNQDEKFQKLSKEDKLKEVDKIMGSGPEREVLNKKYDNIKHLIQTGTL